MFTNLLTQALQLKDVHVWSLFEPPLILGAAIICSLTDPELGPEYV